MANPARADREACLTAHEEGQLLRIRGQYEAARDQFAACSSWTCPKVIAQDCTTLLADVEAMRPTLVFQVTAPDGSAVTDVRVLAEGRLVAARADGRPVTIDRGTHELWFEAPGYQPRKHLLTVRDGEKNTVVPVRLEPAEIGGTYEQDRGEPRAEGGPAPTQTTRSWTTYVVAGSALALLATGTVLGVAGKRDLERLERVCDGSPCERADTSRGRRLYIAADVAFGVGGALALAATWLYVSRFFEDTPGARRAGSTGVDARVDRAGATLVLHTAF